MACYGRGSFGIKRKEDNKPLDELLNLGSSQLSRVPEEQGPFLYIKEEEQRPRVVASSNELPMSDMDLAGFLDMDDKTLSELTGVDSNEWTTLFNGQLDEGNVMDPMMGVQHAETSLKRPDCAPQTCCTTIMSGQQQQQRPAQLDRWLVEETHKLERQQRLQQQKLLELQQTLLKTEILKNQLQIATISQGQSAPSPAMSTTCSILLGALGSGGGGSSLPHQDLTTSQLVTKSANDTGFTQNFGMSGSNSNSTPTSPKLPAVEPTILEMGTSPASVLTPTSNMTTSMDVMSTPPLLVRSSSDIFTDVKPDISLAPPFSPLASDDDSPKLEPSKRKVHNLIEKKYRCSINDRICMLRDMVSKHAKDNKKLQKSAVLQKTIDFIHHLQNTIKKLQDENQQLKESLARVTGNTRLPSFASPPNTPSGTPYESEGDSGHPSSPDDSNSDGMLSRSASPTSKASFFSQFLQNPLRPTTGAASQYLMVVMLVAVFFVNPLALSGQSSRNGLHVVPHSTGSVRTINAYEMDYDDMEVRRSSMDVMVYIGVWVLRLLVTALCFGYMTLKAMPRVIANSQDSVQFWRFKKQAEKDIEEGEFASAKDNLEVALSVINRPLPTSYLNLLTALLWNMLSHFFFELEIGRYAVHLASVFVRAESGPYAMNHPKKVMDIGVSFRDVSETYHLLHQISLSTPKASCLHGMSFLLGLNALNFAEADRPFHRLSQRKLAEMYFTMGLCCHYSFLYGSRLPMWFYFFRFRNVSPSKYATTLKWAVTPPGKAFLMSSKWTSEVGISTKRYAGTAALPAYAVTRAFCKELLCETFGYLLLPDDSPNSQPSRDSEVALQAFKLILNLAKEATSCLLNAEGNEQHIRAVAGCSDSGFTVIQWWASVGIVSCYWLSGKDSSAEDYYPNIEALSGEMGAAVPSAIQLAFKANRKYKMPASSDSSNVPLQVVLQLSATTSNSLKSSVANLLQDHSNSTDNELHHLGLLQACDWLLNLKVTLWENHGNEDNFSKNICPGFYQDLETLSKLITLLPSARSRLHLYKGCYQLIAGANPMTAHALLNSTGSASRIRRRTNSKDVDSENPALYSHEHAMARVMADKHLPSSMESPYNPSRQQEPLLPRTQVALPYVPATS